MALFALCPPEDEDRMLVWGAQGLSLRSRNPAEYIFWTLTWLGCDSLS
jgi:hypothetical protein